MGSLGDEAPKKIVPLSEEELEALILSRQNDEADSREELSESQKKAKRAIEEVEAEEEFQNTESVRHQIRAFFGVDIRKLTESQAEDWIKTLIEYKKAQTEMYAAGVYEALAVAFGGKK